MYYLILLFRVLAAQECDRLEFLCKKKFPPNSSPSSSTYTDNTKQSGNHTAKCLFAKVVSGEKNDYSGAHHFSNIKEIKDSAPI
ncbi:hypothetical protein IB286_07175 [Spongiibacter sp. KMU-158]|uniref:Uncharacterized protein n=1 Tax=Spongiibacter pelagi TaxID=2760804 RepID=A0A927C3H3_9GAMM|nr:hypothetical protein [Spongiibacter pelagi]MBD2858790.1 hypothetical protein [Spongiibacter pelagi]